MIIIYPVIYGCHSGKVNWHVVKSVLIPANQQIWAKEKFMFDWELYDRRIAAKSLMRDSNVGRSAGFASQHCSITFCTCWLKTRWQYYYHYYYYHPTTRNVQQNVSFVWWALLPHVGNLWDKVTACFSPPAVLWVLSQSCGDHRTDPSFQRTSAKAQNSALRTANWHASLACDKMTVITYHWWTLAMLTASQDLIQRNSKGPNVWGERKFTLFQALNGIPAK